MSIITKAGSPVKGSPTEFTLNKSDLALIPSVASDVYFSDLTNWKNVIVYYGSSVGNQKQILNFNAAGSSPSFDFLVSSRARDVFEVQKIIIQDFDGGCIIVPRSELNTSEFDVDMSAAPALNELYFETISTGVTRSGNSISLPSSQSMSYGLDENSLGSGSALLDITFNLSNMSSGKNIRIGLTESVDGITQDSGPASYTRFYFTITDSSIVRFDVGGNQQVILSSSTGSSLTFRIEQTSTQYRYYYNSTLIWTESVQYTLNSYKPFIRSNSTDVTCSATTLSGNAIIWEPISNSYNAEADGGLTNGSGRGGDRFVGVSSSTQVLIGDFELIFNIGNFGLDTAFGFTDDPSGLGPSPFHGTVASAYGENNLHINNAYVTYPSLANSQFKITRIGSTTSFYKDNVLITSTTAITGTKYLYASLPYLVGSGNLISSSII